MIADRRKKTHQVAQLRRQVEEAEGGILVERSEYADVACSRAVGVRRSSCARFDERLQLFDRALGVIEGVLWPCHLG
jgi:hypothetical protein